jgi:hypothetical protein
LSYYFRVTAADDASGMADAGRGKLALVPNGRSASPLWRMVCREAQEAPIGEQELLDHIFDVVHESGYGFPRALIVNYYVSLKTNPFVILTGAEGHGKTEVARLFAEALVGRDGPQYTLIPSAGVWPDGTGEDSYYRSLHEQFSSWRFLDLLQEAALPSNIHKAYFVCFDALHPDELEYYFATLLQVDPTGAKRLNLPGFPADRQLTIPSNVYITATVNTAEHKEYLSRNVLRHAGLIEFRAPHWSTEPSGLASAAASVPPIGFQRIWLRTALHDVSLARTRLATILGEDRYGRLRCSPKLTQLLWRTGLALTNDILQELETYIANSFDLHGRGLFDPHDAHHNAQIAYDSQVLQRFLWRLRDSPDQEIRRDLAEYLDLVAFGTAQQAVA